MLGENIKKVEDTKSVANGISEQLVEQSEKMNAIEGQIDMTQGTMKRLQSYLTYFGKQYCKDGLILCLIITIVLVIIGIIIASAV